MKRSKKAIAERLTAAGIAIQNALVDPDLGSPLALYGYDAVRIQQGQALLVAAQAAVQTQVSASGGWQTGTVSLALAEDEARAAYQALVQVVKAAFGRNNGPVLAKLGITGPMPKRQGTFLVAAMALFVNLGADAALAAEVAKFGYGPKRLAAEQAKITAMEAALQAREVAKGSAQQATAIQDAALKNLDLWMGAFIRVARVAFRGQEQLLEKLGLLARNTRTPAQRHAPAKAAQTRRERRQALTVVTKKEAAQSAA